jgi:hypothetical protein
MEWRGEAVMTRSLLFSFFTPGEFLQKTVVTSLCVGVLSTLPTTAHAQVYDAVADFSLTTNQNVNGVWSYGSTAVSGGTFSLLPLTGSALSGSLQGWRDEIGSSANGNTFPLVYSNISGVTQVSGTFSMPTTVLLLHPASTGANAVVRWTAPSSGLYRINGQYQLLEGGSTDVTIRLNSTELLTEGNLGEPIRFDFLRNVNTGDQIDFSVGSGGNGYSSDGTGLAVTISPASAAAPEPSALCLFAIGLVPAARRYRSKDKE